MCGYETVSLTLPSDPDYLYEYNSGTKTAPLAPPEPFPDVDSWFSVSDPDCGFTKFELFETPTAINTYGQLALTPPLTPSTLQI